LEVHHKNNQYTKMPQKNYDMKELKINQLNNVPRNIPAMRPELNLKLLLLLRKPNN